MDHQELLVSREGRLGRIRLNRPEALNSLTLEMVRAFTLALDSFDKDADTAAVLVTGEGARAFCAGGDIRALYDAQNSDKSAYKEFWREEYRLNARIAAFRKPYVALMDGFVMGGGVGVSAHGNRRVVTERTRLAMPETGIGFIPDVGGTWLLTRRDGVGLYMALSGVAVSAADALHAGLANAMIASARIPDFIDRLAAISAAQDVDEILRDLAVAPDEGELERHKESLDRALAGDRIEDVLCALDACGSVFARNAAAEIRRKSPTSVKVTHALLKRALMTDRLETCLLNEYRAACGLLKGHDLYEGIRAAIVEKDRSPLWRPATLADVSDGVVEEILRGTGDPDPVFD
ncbi:MAG: 3-hydroxyisobutyryl-CoA hydrolase [Methylocystis sp.]|nr:MAG: 3-hydroxyisobutyryl-CoA hydrolase [Methylocystis sp.]